MNIAVNAFYANQHDHPERLALSIGDTRLTYGQLGRIVQGIRQTVDDVSAPGARLIGVASNQDTSSYASLLAVLASGRGYVPLPPSWPLERNLDIIRQTGITTLLTSQPFDALQQACADVPLRFVDTSTPDPAPLAPPADVGPDDLAYVLFTSGSTGRPKGVPIRHRNLDRFFRAMHAEFGTMVSADDRFLQMFEFSFDVSVVAFLYPLMIGASVHPVPPRRHRTSFDILNTIQSAKVTVATLVPSALSPLARYADQLTLPDVRISILTGEGLAVSLAQAWSTCVSNARQFNLYGPTEATIWASIYDYTDDLPNVAQDRGVVSIGRPFDGFRFQIVDGARAAVPAGEYGELCIASDQLAGSYWNAPELTARAYTTLKHGDAMPAELYYCTGDYVREVDGHFLYNGRIDDQVQVGGHRVELGEIEHQARRFLGAIPTAAVAKTHTEGFVQIVLCVEGSDVATADVMSALRASLPHYMVPQKIVAVPSFPLNNSGKVDKRRLREMVVSPEGRKEADGQS